MWKRSGNTWLHGKILQRSGNTSWLQNLMKVKEDWLRGFLKEVREYWLRETLIKVSEYCLFSNLNISVLRNPEKGYEILMEGQGRSGNTGWMWRPVVDLWDSRYSPPQSNFIKTNNKRLAARSWDCHTTPDPLPIPICPYACNGSFTLRGTGIGTGTGNDGFLYYIIYYTCYTRTGARNHCFLLCPSRTLFRCMWAISATEGIDAESTEHGKCSKVENLEYHRETLGD